MDFGKIPNFFEADFTLAEDHPQTSEVLREQDKGSRSQLKVYLGAPMWSHKNFVGKIYPPGTKAQDFLHYYTQHFDAIELNTTHYQIPDQQRVESWNSKVMKGLDFHFCPKFPQQISHAQGDFSSLEQPIGLFLESLSYFKNFLGTSFIQLPQHFDTSYAGFLINFLQRFPQNTSLSIELRHASWFQESKIADKVFQLMQRKKLGTVISDVAGRRDVCHMRLTNKQAFIRFTGNSLHSTDFQRLDSWIERLKKWEEQGLESVYFFMHQPDESQCVELAQYFAKNSKFECRSPQILKKMHQLDLLDM